MTEPTRQSDVTSPQNQERFEYGLDVMGQIDSDMVHDVIDQLADVAPDFAHHIAAFAFGDIYDRPGLSPPERQLVTLGILTTLGGCEPQLRVHLSIALSVGLTPQEIIEALMHAAIFCGFARALTAITLAKDVFTEAGLMPLDLG